ncbi:hypothetical protein G9A89_019159 [Geosiphon pyriformis]|nr:hypothetical protein G9A89_019159 [Geosiphon pyriformis]
MFKKLGQIFRVKSTSASSPVISSTASSPTDEKKRKMKFFSRNKRINGIFILPVKVKSADEESISNKKLSLTNGHNTSEQNTVSLSSVESRHPNPNKTNNSQRKNQSQIRLQDNSQRSNTKHHAMNSTNKAPIYSHIEQRNIDKTNSIAPETPNTIRQNEADEIILQAIKFHETNELEKATFYFKLAADKESPLGLFLYGIALRHGWGCKVNTKLAVHYLQKAAESAVYNIHSSAIAAPSIARHELVLAIHELGVSFRHGWGVPKNKSTAAYYFEIAANLGDPDAQNDLGFAYANGEGVKKDRKMAAKYYRMAAAQGASIMGNSWISKKKYDPEL